MGIFAKENLITKAKARVKTYLSLTLILQLLKKTKTRKILLTLSVTFVSKKATILTSVLKKS